MNGKRLGCLSTKPSPPNVNALTVAFVSGRLVTAVQPLNTSFDESKRHL